MHNSGEVICAHILPLLRLKLRLPNVSPGASLLCPCSAWLSQSSTTGCAQCHHCFISCCIHCVNALLGTAQLAQIFQAVRGV